MENLNERQTRVLLLLYRMNSELKQKDASSACWYVWNSEMKHKDDPMWIRINATVRDIFGLVELGLIENNRYRASKCLTQKGYECVYQYINSADFAG